MAGIMETLVLRGNRVVSGVVNGMVRSGSDLADRQTPGLLSHPRRLSQPAWQAGYTPATPSCFIDARDEDDGCSRAGRLGSLVGVLFPPKCRPANTTPAGGTFPASTRGKRGG